MRRLVPLLGPLLCVLAGACSDPAPSGAAVDAAIGVDGAGHADTACTDACPGPGATSCDGLAGYRLCGDFDGDGCVEWGVANPCPGGLTCAEGSCVAPCTPECTLGETQCDADGKLQLCFDPGDGCRRWSASLSCGVGQTCVDGACEATCVDACPTAGAARCEGNAFALCVDRGDGCLVWAAPIACDVDETCTAGVCEQTCVPSCEDEGATRCGTGGGVETCVDAGGDCLMWSAPQPCAAGSACEAGECSATCAPECGAVGETECFGSATVTCEDPGDGCLAWGVPAACEAGDFCVAGACVATCTSQCSQVGDTRCALGGLQTCGDVGDGCLQWSTPVPCAAAEACLNGACEPPCTPECATAGVMTCVDDATAVCFDPGDGCLRWSAPLACPSGETCQGDACAPVCVPGCDSAGDARCDGDAVETCEDPGDGCLDWSAPVACAADASCVDGACVTDPCFDADCGALWEQTCSGTNGYKVCGKDPATGCGALSSFIACAEGNQCQAGSCSGACLVPEIMLVVDRSSSMEGARWAFLTATLDTFLQTWQARARIGVRVFPDDGASCAAGAPVTMGLDNGDTVQLALTTPAAASATPIAAALTDLGTQFGDPQQAEAVILLTDGSETCASTDAALAATEALRGRGTRTWAIGVGTTYDQLFLDDVATAGGTFEHLAAADQATLEQVLTDIMLSLGTCCPDPDGDGYGDYCPAGPDCDESSPDHHAPDCTDLACGDDGCGGSCGECNRPSDLYAAATCVAGTCVEACVASPDVYADVGGCRPYSREVIDAWGSTVPVPDQVRLALGPGEVPFVAFRILGPWMADKRSGSWTLSGTLAFRGYPLMTRAPGLVPDVFVHDTDQDQLLAVVDNAGTWQTGTLLDGTPLSQPLFDVARGATHWYLAYEPLGTERLTIMSSDPALDGIEVDAAGDPAWPRVAVDGGGVVHVAYTDYTLNPAETVHAWSSSGVFLKEVLGLGPLDAGGLGVAPDGTLWLAATDAPADEVWVATNAGGAWAHDALLGAYTIFQGPDARPDLVVDAAGVPHAVWSVGANGLHYLRRDAGGWTSFELESDGDLCSAPSLALAADGAVHVAYGTDPYGGTEHARIVHGVLGPPEPAPVVDWCRFQWPDVAEVAPGEAFTAYVRFYEPGLTDLTGGNDPDAGLTVEIGWGPPGSSPLSMPSAFAWQAATPNPGWSDGVEPNNDEYQATVAIPAQGTWDVAARLSLDGGATWLACDLDGSPNGYTFSAAARAVVTAP